MIDDVLQSTTDQPCRVLLTGAAGAIGRVVGPALVKRGHVVRGLDRCPTDTLDDHIVADLADPDALAQAFDGVDTVIHLAAYPNDADFVDVLVPSNIIATHHIYEAARIHQLHRVIAASSMQVISGHRRLDRPITIADGPAPLNHYALTKILAEQTGNMYARVHSLGGFAVRIGWFPRTRKECAAIEDRREAMDYVLTHDDAARFFIHCVEAADPPNRFAILFATSKPVTQTTLDLTDARDMIGYEPFDQYPQGCDFGE